MDHDRVEAHFEWRKRCAKGLPELAARVFALRGRLYMGAGFHYAMERTLGKAIAFLNSYDDRPKLEDTLIEPMVLSGLYNDVVKAEQSAIEWDAKNQVA